jgi:hypothetical protein
MAKITIPNKSTGDSLTASEQNEVKDVVNTNDDEAISLGSRVAQNEEDIAALDNEANRQAIARSIVTQTLLIHNGTEATETVVNFGDEETDDWKIVGGVVEIKTITEEVSCSIEIHLEKAGAQDAEFDCWLEASADGLVWSAIDLSLRREVIDKDGASNVVADFSFNFPLPVGGMFRIVATNNGANTLSMEKPADIVTANGGANGFAKTIRLVKIK